MSAPREVPDDVLAEPDWEAAQADAVADQVAAWARTGRNGRTVKATRPRAPSIHREAIYRAAAEADAMRESGDWSTARPLHLVALHAILHKHTYGAALTLDGRDAAQAAIAAGKLTERLGGVDEAVEHLAWAWERERQREEWRRKNGRDGGTLGWRLVLGGRLVDEHAVSIRRAKAAVR